MYFRNSSPRTRCLYSADSTLPRSLFAASKSAAAFGLSPLPLISASRRQGTANRGPRLGGMDLTPAMDPGASEF